MSSNKPAVLLTGAGGAAIPGLITRLRKAGFFVVVVDMNPQAAGLVFADAGAVVPAGGSPNFLPACAKFAVGMTCARWCRWLTRN